ISTGTLDKAFNQATGSYFDKTCFGITFPVGLAVAFSPTREWSIGLGVDVNLGLGVAGVGALSFGISPMAGPEIEYRIDDQIVIGLNTRFGAGIAITSDTQYPEIGRYIPGDTITKFAFKTQLVLVYKMCSAHALCDFLRIHHDRRAGLVDHILVHQDLTDVRLRRDVVHDVEHRRLEDRAQAARPALVAQRRQRHLLQRALGELQLHA